LDSVSGAFTLPRWTTSFYNSPTYLLTLNKQFPL